MKVMLGISLLFVLGLFMICYGGFRINDAAGFIITGTILVMMSVGLCRQAEKDALSTNHDQKQN
jgi:hypothetical protein